MAINPNTALSDVLQAASRATAAASPADNSGSRLRNLDWMEQGAAFKDPIRRNTGTEAVNNIVKAFQENLSRSSKAFADEYATSVIVLDKTVHTTLAFSCVLVCVKEKAPGAKVVSYHTLIVESTNDGKLNRTEQYDGRTIEIVQVAGDAYDGELIRVAQTVLESEFPGCVFSRADVTRVPRAFAEDPAAKDPKHYLELAANSISACFVDLRIRAGYADINISESRGDKSLTVELDFKDRTTYDIVGEPIRTDVNVRFFSEQRAQQNNRSLNNGSVSKPIAHASGFIDLNWAPAAEQGSGFGFYNQPQANIRATQKYAANLVLTDVMPEAAPTPAVVMLTILTAAATVRSDNNYYGAFVPKHHLGGRVDSHDIGAINYEANIGNVPAGQEVMRIDTTAANFTMQNLGQLLAATIHPGLAISVDIPESSPASYYMSFLRAAALNEDGAAELVIKSLNDLTDGRFGQHFQGGQIFTDPGIRVHGGSYVSADGELRDIRDVDYLYLLNSKQAGFLETVAAWSDARLAKNVSADERGARSYRIIMAMLPSATVTSFYHRVTFTDEVISAGIRALHECGLAPRIRTPFNAGDMNHQRQVAQSVTNALGNPQSMVNMFSYNGSVGAQQSNYRQGAATRYGY